MDSQPTPDDSAAARHAFGASESSDSSNFQGEEESSPEDNDHETTNDNLEGGNNNNGRSMSTIAGDQGRQMLSGFGGEADNPTGFIAGMSTGGRRSNNSLSNPKNDREVSLVRGGMARDLEEGPTPDWLMRSTAVSTLTTVAQEKRPWPPLWEPRHCPHDCRRVHALDTSSWGPGANAGWNVSNLPTFRSPASPRLRLFGAIKETRPGTEPKVKLEQLKYTPEQVPSRTHQPYNLRLGSLEGWKSSNRASNNVSLTPTYRQWRKLHPCATRSSFLNYEDLTPEVHS